MKFNEETLEQAVIELMQAEKNSHCKGEKINYQKWLVPKWNTPLKIK